MSALMAANDYMVSDCTIQQLSELMDRLKNYQIADLVSPDGRNVLGEGGFMEYYLDEDSLQRIILDSCFAPVLETAA